MFKMNSKQLCNFQGMYKFNTIVKFEILSDGDVIVFI